MAVPGCSWVGVRRCQADPTPGACGPHPGAGGQGGGDSDVISLPNQIRVGNHDITAGDRKTRLIFQEPKTEQSRWTIPIPDDIVEALRHHKARQAEERLLIAEAYEDHGLVFCQANDQPIDPRNFTGSFERLLRQAALPRIRFHDGRHTFATPMLELGEAPKTVQTMFGHSKISPTLDIYSHVSLDLEKKAAARLNLVEVVPFCPGSGNKMGTALEPGGGHFRDAISDAGC